MNQPCVRSFCFLEIFFLDKLINTLTSNYFKIIARTNILLLIENSSKIKLSEIKSKISSIISDNFENGFSFLSEITEDFPRLFCTESNIISRASI
jgi:hypothetical protein